MKNITNFRALLLTLCLTAFSILPSWALIGPYCESNITLLNGTPIQMSFVQTGTNDYVIVITSSSYKITAVNGFAHTSGNNTYHYGAAGHYSISDDGYTATIPFTSTFAPKLYNDIYIIFETIGEQKTGIFNEQDISWSTPATCSLDPVSPCDTKHFYYVKIGGTAYTNVYMWNSSNTSEENANWPGVAMSTTVPELSILGASIYEITYEGANYDQVIFNDGENKTGDLDIENCKFYMDGNWYNSIEEIEEHFVFYINTPGWSDANVKAHIWKNGGSDMHTWNVAAEQMTVTNTTTNDDHKIHYYYVSSPSSYDKVIFHNNGSNQSANLDLEYGHYFNYADNCWYTSTKYLNFSNGGWSLTPFTWSDYSKTIQTASVTISNDAVNYEFNIKGDGSSYYYNHGTMAENNCTDWKFNENSSSNCWINPDVPGDYIFNYDFAENKLSVIYPPYMLTASYVS